MLCLSLASCLCFLRGTSFTTWYRRRNREQDLNHGYQCPNRSWGVTVAAVPRKIELIGVEWRLSWCRLDSRGMPFMGNALKSWSLIWTVWARKLDGLDWLEHSELSYREWENISFLQRREVSGSKWRSGFLYHVNSSYEHQSNTLNVKVRTRSTRYVHNHMQN